MRLEIAHVLADEHVQRLRDAAQAPAGPLTGRISALVRRRAQPAAAAPIARRSDAPEVDRLAA